MSASCTFSVGNRVVHTIWGRHAKVVSIRELKEPAKQWAKGSRWVVRVEWDGGGWGVDGDAHFALETKP